MCFVWVVIVEPFLIWLSTIFRQFVENLFCVRWLSSLERGVSFGAAYATFVFLNGVLMYLFAVQVLQRGFLFFMFSLIFLLYLVFERVIFRSWLYDLVQPNGSLFKSSNEDEKDRSLSGYYIKTFVFLVFEQLVVSAPFIIGGILFTLTIDVPLLMRFSG